MGIRIVVIDDNPHVSWESRIYPVNATFHRFLTAVLDVPGEPVASIVHCVPVRPATSAPATLPLDERLEVVATTAFDGIADYLRHAPWIVSRNARLLRPVIRAADLVWIKVPASNALLAATLARAAGIPRFGYVAGSAAEVAAGQDRGRPGGGGARLVGAAYDLAGRIASAGGDRLVVGANLEAGGVVTSLVEPEDVRDRSKEAWPAHADVLRLAWAGRLVEGKGLEALLDAVAQIAVEPPEGRLVQLVLLGDGPARPALEARASSLGVEQRVVWRGFIADRAIYLEALAACDLFVFPSPAEGFPKVVLDAMAVGLPVVARPSGSLEDLAASGVIERVDRQAGQIGAEIRRLVANPARVAALRRAGSAFAAEHTRAAEAGRLASRWRERWPNLPWDRPGPGSARIAGKHPAARTRGE